MFGLAAAGGLRYSPYGPIDRPLAGPRLGPPGELEEPAGPRFAQGVGLAITCVGLIGYAVGLVPPGTAAAPVAAFLNAAFGLCLGCEMHAAAAPGELDKEVPA